MHGNLCFKGLDVIQGTKKSDVIDVDQHDEWVPPKDEHRFQVWQVLPAGTWTQTCRYRLPVGRYPALNIPVDVGFDFQSHRYLRQVPGFGGFNLLLCQSNRPKEARSYLPK